MPLVGEHTFVGCQLQIGKEKIRTPTPEQQMILAQGGDVAEEAWPVIDYTTITIIDPATGSRYHIKLTPESKNNLVEKLTGGVAVPNILAGVRLN